MADKEYAQGIYVKKFTNQYGDWISVSIKNDKGGNLQKILIGICL